MYLYKIQMLILEDNTSFKSHLYYYLFSSHTVCGTFTEAWKTTAAKTYTFYYDGTPANDEHNHNISRYDWVWKPRNWRWIVYFFPYFSMLPQCDLSDTAFGSEKTFS